VWNKNRRAYRRDTSTWGVKGGNEDFDVWLPNTLA